MGSAETSHALLAGPGKGVEVCAQARETEMLRLRRDLLGAPPFDLRGHGQRQGRSPVCATGAEAVVSADCGCLFNIWAAPSTWTAPKAGQPPWWASTSPAFCGSAGELP